MTTAQYRGGAAFGPFLSHFHKGDEIVPLSLASLRGENPEPDEPDTGDDNQPAGDEQDGGQDEEDQA